MKKLLRGTDKRTTPEIKIIIEDIRDFLKEVQKRIDDKTLTVIKSVVFYYG